jgi:hypothetical protein
MLTNEQFRELTKQKPSAAKRKEDSREKLEKLRKKQLQISKQLKNLSQKETFPRPDEEEQQLRQPSKRLKKDSSTEDGLPEDDQNRRIKEQDFQKSLRKNIQEFDVLQEK